MIIRNTKITIKRIRKPREHAQWFFESLGLLGQRDKDRSCFRMVITLLKDLRRGEGMTSDEISEKVNLSRGTVVHHLHKLMNAGVVVNQRNRYMLRVDSLSNLVDEIEHDLYRTMDSLKKAAEEIDKKLEL